MESGTIQLSQTCKIYFVPTPKYNYYEDNVVNDYEEHGISARGYASTRYSKKKGHGIAVKAERVIFMPPGAIVPKHDYSISNSTVIIPKLSSHKKEIKTDGYTIEMNSSDTYLTFRSFLTYSTTENFEKEQYVDNVFYVSSVTTIPNDTSWVNKLYSPLKFYHINLQDKNIEQRNPNRL